MNFPLNRFGGILAALIVLTLVSCRQKEDKTVPLPVLRYDVALMNLDTAALQEGLRGLNDSFPLYLEGADWNNPLNIKRIRNFIDDPVVKLCYGKIKEQYADNSRIGLPMARIFDRTRLFFPDFQNPKIYTYISYFDFVNRVMYLDSALSIALDLYIDGNESSLDEIGVPRYMSCRLNAAYLEADVARAIGSALIPRQERENLLDYIVYEGKVVYFMENVLPKTNMEVILGYSSQQLLWCRTHEKEIWQYIVHGNLLFETNPMKFRYFINEGPFNPLLEGAPARLAQFIGGRMVHAYMKRMDNNFQALLAASSQQVLQASSYRP